MIGQPQQLSSRTAHKRYACGFRMAAETLPPSASASNDGVYRRTRA
jgi:hypothetical protein